MKIDMSDAVAEQKAMKFTVISECRDPGCNKMHTFEFTAHDIIETVSSLSSQIEMMAQFNGGDEEYIKQMVSVCFIARMFAEKHFKFDPAVLQQIEDMWTRQEATYKEREVKIEAQEKSSGQTDLVIN